MSETNSPSAFQLVAGHPALDLVNTLDWRFREQGPEELLSSYDDLVRFVEQSELITPKQARLLRAAGRNVGERVLARCTELREATAEIFYAAMDGREPALASIQALEELFKAMRAGQKLEWKDARLEWNWCDGENEVELPLRLLTLSTAELMTSDAMHKVRVCDSPECRWLFLDTSKNHLRRWCDMKICGNRMKARRFKARQKA